MNKHCGNTLLVALVSEHVWNDTDRRTVPYEACECLKGLYLGEQGTRATFLDYKGPLIITELLVILAMLGNNSRTKDPTQL